MKMYIISKSSLIAVFFLLLHGCAFTVPVVVVGEDGRVLKGTNHASWTSGTFSVSDAKLTCSGSYDPLQSSDEITMPVICSDGRKGIVRATRDTGDSGWGTVLLNDGYRAEFMFGDAAADF